MAGDKIYQYWATTLGGLEELVLDDLREQLGPLENVRVEGGRRLGRILFHYERSPRKLVGLLSVESVYARLAEVYGVTVGGPGLERVCAQIARVDLAPALRLVRSLHPGIEAGRFQLSAVVQGEHRFSSGQASRAVSRILQERHGLQPSSGEVLGLHLQISGKRALFGLRLPRGQEAGQTTGPRWLGGTLFYALVRLLGLRAGNRLLVLRCAPEGLAERVRALGLSRPLALFEQAPGEPLQELDGLRAHPGALPLLDQVLDGVLGGVEEGLERSQVAEVFRVLLPGGVAALLVTQARLFVAQLRESGLPIEIMAALPIYLRGRKYTVFLLERLPEDASEQALLRIEIDA